MEPGEENDRVLGSGLLTLWSQGKKMIGFRFKGLGFRAFNLVEPGEENDRV